MNKVKVWLKGLLAAAISGSASAVGAVALIPEKFNLNDFSSLGKVALGGAIIGLVAYLQQSPIWNGNGTAK